MHGYIQSPVQAVDIRSSQLDTPVDIQLVDVQQALRRQIEEEKAQDRISQPFSLLPNGEIPVLQSDGAYVQPQAGEQPALVAQGGKRAIWYDRLLFVLVALLVLGIVGGLSFGYLLSLAHLTLLQPVFLSVVSQAVQL
jgi:hypothetical protein